MIRYSIGILTQDQKTADDLMLKFITVLKDSGIGFDAVTDKNIHGQFDNQIGGICHCWACFNSVEHQFTN